MHAIMLMLSLVAPPAEPAPAIPLGSSRPDEGGFVVCGGPLYGGIGAGWHFRDGSRVDVGPRGVEYSRTLHDSEWARCITVSGSRAGAACEVYLGQGCTVETAPGRMAVTWYAWENAALSIGVDLLTGHRGWGWRVSF
jgi:hypothetical protein